MSALLVGVVSIGVVVGLMVGRITERARRGMKDLATARATATKARKVAYADTVRAAGAVLITALIFVALFLGALKSQS